MVSLPAGSGLGRYQILDQIGRGGMATVFRAYDSELDRHIAMKVMPSFQAEDPTFVARFRQEAQAVAALVHPSIIQVHDFGEDKGFAFIVMEHVTGGTLSDYMANPLPIDEVLHWVSPLAEALDYAHGKGIIHRDVKPDNVLVDSQQNTKLSDFGLARLVEGSAGLTGPDSILGTPNYIAPERVMGASADQKSDLYSFAVVVYEMLLGRVPFQGETASEIIMAHIHQPVPLPSTIDPEFGSRLEAVVIRALAKEPNDRFATGSQLVTALESTMTGGGSKQDLGSATVAAERRAGPSPVSGSERNDTDRSETKILLVEDNEMNRDMLSRRLQRRKYQVALALDGEQGIEMAKSLSPALILMDMSLPVLDGWEATRRLKADPNTQGIPIIALTAHAMSEDRDKAMAAGCDDFETKPIEFSRLLAKIEAQLDR